MLYIKKETMEQEMRRLWIGLAAIRKEQVESPAKNRLYLVI